MRHLPISNSGPKLGCLTKPHHKQILATVLSNEGSARHYGGTVFHDRAGSAGVAEASGDCAWQAMARGNPRAVFRCCSSVLGFHRLVCAWKL